VPPLSTPGGSARYLYPPTWFASIQKNDTAGGKIEQLENKIQKDTAGRRFEQLENMAIIVRNKRNEDWTWNGSTTTTFSTSGP
jgi:hypothetical protein